MAKALARREITAKVLSDYILDETESILLLGPGEVPLLKARREYLWYVRDGKHVRSPLTFNGVVIGPTERDQYEQRWQAREERRVKREAERAKNRTEKEAAPPMDPVDAAGAAALSNEPRFVADAYFLEFKFDPGNYYLVGREALEGRDVLRIEYYPTRLFDADEDARRAEAARQRGDRKHEHQTEADITRKMNKTALVTLWVDPSVSQIVKYTFDNVWLDFLPGGWLVKVDELQATMTMKQPFKETAPDVWLPHEITIKAGATVAAGSYDASYSRKYTGYREADVKAKVRIGKPGGFE
jgi:hypothetical protein